MQPVGNVGNDVTGLEEGFGVVGLLVGASDGCTEGGLLIVGIAEGWMLAVGACDTVGDVEGVAEGAADGVAEGGAEGSEEGVEVGNTDGVIEGAMLPVGWELIVGSCEGALEIVGALEIDGAGVGDSDGEADGAKD
jgi:hypothetical protein